MASRELDLVRIRVCRLPGPAVAWRSVLTWRVCWGLLLGPAKCLTLFKSPAREGFGAYIMLGAGRLNECWRSNW